LSYSNLTNAGLGDLAVFSVADYVAKAAELAADPARRLMLRHELRAQIAAHPLGQPARFTTDFYELARKVASA
jgi:protein O-GlcNAc transferase